MEEKNIRITYTSGLARKPITHDLIHNYPTLGVNIMRAQVSPSSGWMELHITGSGAVISEAIVWLQEQGIQVEIVDKKE